MRISRDQMWCEQLRTIRQRSTCLRRHTASLIVDHFNRVVSTGFNGVPWGFPHCNEGTPCSPLARVNSSESGDSADEGTYCKAAHAEQNALIQMPDSRVVKAMYCTNLPCFTCAKLILNTTIEYVCAIEDYPDHRGLQLLLEREKMAVRVGNDVYSKTNGHIMKLPVHGSESFQEIGGTT